MKTKWQGVQRILPVKQGTLPFINDRAGRVGFHVKKAKGQGSVVQGQ